MDELTAGYVSDMFCWSSISKGWEKTAELMLDFYSNYTNTSSENIIAILAACLYMHAFEEAM